MNFPTLKAIQKWSKYPVRVTDEPRLVTAKKDEVYYYFQQDEDVYKLMMTSLHDVTKDV